MDRNVTRRLLDAYSGFIRKQSEKITITTLCEKADISRATFYVYFSDIDDFYEKINKYMIDKFFCQATLILSCSESEFSKTVKKENLIFDENELVILSHMIKGVKYIDFALLVDEYYSDKNNHLLYTTEMWNKYRREIDIFFRGYLPILITDLYEYDELRFKKDMIYCRLFFRELYKYMKSGV